MRPREGSEVQQNRLCVLNLLEMNRKFAWHRHVKRCYARERRHTLKRHARCGADRELLTYVQGPHKNGRFDGFVPQIRRHLQGLGVRRGSCGLAQQECNIVAPASEGWWSRGRGND